MNVQATGKRLPLSAVLIMLSLCIVWGANMAAIKISSEMLAPVFSAFTRSVLATICLALWMRMRKIPFFPDRVTVLHGVVVGLLFAVEFGCIYMGMKYTLASRAYLLLYTHPFFVALGGHYLLHQDKLSARKVVGLCLAFGGVALLFAKDWGELSVETLPGDLLFLFGGFLWAATSIYVKKYLAVRAEGVQTLFYHLCFSIPLLLPMSLIIDEKIYLGFSWPGFWAQLYQGVIVAFASYVVWFEMLHRHTASLLTAYTFFAPVFGVAISGWFILGEPVTGGLLICLVMVASGMVVMNPPKAV
ncbi:MAG: EamA/RhaT family transporter [Deltaproteobacteria bacterium]|nr:MAG: EamA/RhaT family transporter [Deltaproteobacteria bacterium]